MGCESHCHKKTITIILDEFVGNLKNFEINMDNRKKDHVMKIHLHEKILIVKIPTLMKDKCNFFPIISKCISLKKSYYKERKK